MQFDLLTRRRVLMDLVCVGGVIGLTAALFSQCGARPSASPTPKITRTPRARPSTVVRPTRLGGDVAPPRTPTNSTPVRQYEADGKMTAAPRF